MDVQSCLKGRGVERKKALFFLVFFGQGVFYSFFFFFFLREFHGCFLFFHSKFVLDCSYGLYIVSKVVFQLFLVIICRVFVSTVLLVLFLFYGLLGFCFKGFYMALKGCSAVF